MILSGQLDEHFSEHMKYHNVTHNQEFLFATFFLDVKGIEKTIEFMMNGGKERRDGTETSTLDVLEKETFQNIRIQNITQLYDEAIKFQVREDLEKIKGGRNGWSGYEWTCREVCEKVDFDTLLSIRKMQIELLGSTKLYEIVDKNLKEAKTHPLFVREELKLYEWREKFFYRHFPSDCWTNGTNAQDKFETVPLLVTECFITIEAHVAAKFKKDDLRLNDDNDDDEEADEESESDDEDDDEADSISEYDKVYFDEYCEDHSYKAEYFYDFKGMIEMHAEDGNYFYDSSKDYELPFERSLHVLVAMYPGKPLPLGYYAMKKVVELGIPLSEIPNKALRDQATKGFLSTKEDAKEYLNCEGKKLLEWNCEDLDVQPLSHDLTNFCLK